MQRLVAFFLLIPCLATAQLKQLDSLFDRLTHSDLAAGSITITQNGKLLYQRSFGEDTAATYRIGSITKLFTAVMIYQAIDARQLSLTDTLNRFFPDLPNAGQITIAEPINFLYGM